LVTLEHHPEYDWPRWVKGLALFHLGRDEEARETMSGLTEGWADEWPETIRALDMARSGDDAGARQLLEEAVRSGSPLRAGLICLALGDLEEGIGVLRDGLPFAWDGALYLRYFRAWPLGEARGEPSWWELISELDRAWGVSDRPSTPRG
jgi:hypothetical protein